MRWLRQVSFHFILTHMAIVHLARAIPIDRPSISAIPPWLDAQVEVKLLQEGRQSSSTSHREDALTWLQRGRTGQSAEAAPGLSA